MISFFKYLTQTNKLNKDRGGLSLLNHTMIYKEWKSQIKSKKNPLDLELPWITIIAKNYIKNFLNNKIKPDLKVFEFGSGGSSLFFLQYAGEVISAEHDEKWFDLVKNSIEQKKIKGWHGNLLKPELVPDSLPFKPDPGNPGHYASSANDFTGYSFKKYASLIDQFPDDYFDVVLVDGRSRPSCLLHSINKVKKGGLLVLDNAERPYYLANNILSMDKFDLVLSSNGALICYEQFTQTNIYIKK
jgi:hypothetical protein